ncbi:MAG: DUF1653 domain-containing protein [Candidatus Paracaedibacteraceae bacterium]|nr:DUF1653 domain-containing protein [Candidatus Paracaedibacteraceae bacterium]
MKLGIYQHYSGKLYQVIGIARHSETLEELVVYQCLYGSYGLWIRPRAMFEEVIENKGEPQPRFKYISGGVTEPAELR